MGNTEHVLMSKLLAAFALLAVASAHEIFSAFYSSADCSGNPSSSSKITLDVCYQNAPGDYRKVTLLGGTTYSNAAYSDSSCTTSQTAMSPNPVTGVADACASYTSSRTARSAKITDINAPPPPAPIWQSAQAISLDAAN